jgi:hypothetical protein
MPNKLNIEVAPVVVAFVVTVLFFLAAEAETPVHLLARAWSGLAMVVLILASWRFSPFRQFSRPNYANRRANVITREYDRWGAALTGTLIATGLVLLYLLD